LATESEIARWDELVAANPDGGRPAQTRAWGELKSRWGWQPRRYIYELMSGKPVAAQWLVRRLPLTGEFWYCPAGPGVVSFGDLRQVVEQTRIGVPGAAWLRLEPMMPVEGVPATDLTGMGIVKSERDVEAKSELFLRLSDYDFPDKAAKIGLMVAPVAVNDETAATVYELMRAAAAPPPPVKVPGVATSSVTVASARPGGALRPPEYYRDLWKTTGRGGRGQLFLVRFGGDTVGGAFVSTAGRRAWSREFVLADVASKKRIDLLVHCEIMRWLQKRGVAEYALPLELGADFGLKPTVTIGAWDLPVVKWKYMIWRWTGEWLLR